MASTSAHHAVYSALTLAALEDSGWYRANYSTAEPLLWGRNAGCAFATAECIDGAEQPLDSQYFCTERMAAGCTADHRARGYCNLAGYPGDLPAGYQHFSDTTQGSSLSVADYCPFYQSWANGDCTDATNAPYAHLRLELPRSRSTPHLRRTRAPRPPPPIGTGRRTTARRATARPRAASRPRSRR